MREIMTEIKEQEAAPLVVETPGDYVSALARTRLDLDPRKLQKALESDVIGSPAQLASTLDKVEGREVVLNYLTPGGTRVRVSSDREYPKDSKLGKVSNLLEAAARFKVLGQEETVPDQVKLAGWQIERGIKDFQKEAERVASGKTLEGKKVEVAKKATILALALAACSRTNIEMPIPATEIFPVEPTAAQVFEATQISPVQNSETEQIIIVSQRQMSSEEVLAVDPRIAETFTNFQNEIRVETPDATFDVWGALATAQDGATYVTPFFEVREGEVLSSEYVVFAREDGRLVYLKLEQREVVGPDGRSYLTLSQIVNAETAEELPTPVPFLWVPYSRAEWDSLTPEEQASAQAFFNGFGGIVAESQTLGGGREFSIRQLISTSDIQQTPENQEQVAELRRMIEEFMSLDNDVIREYINQYQVLIPQPGGPYVPPILGDNHLPIENRFAISGIQPNMGLLIEDEWISEHEDLPTRSVYLQGILLGTHSLRIEDINYHFMIVGHLIGDEKFVLAYILGPTGGTPENPIYDYPSSVTIRDWPASEEERIFFRESYNLEPLAQNLPLIEALPGRLIHFSIPAGVSPSAIEQNYYNHDPLFRNIYDDANPEFIEWRQHFSELYPVNPDYVTLLDYSMENGEFLYQGFRSLYLRLMVTGGLSPRYPYPPVSYHQLLTDENDYAYIERFDAEHLLGLTDPSRFQAWSYPLVNVFYLSQTTGGDPPLIVPR